MTQFNKLSCALASLFLALRSCVMQRREQKIEEKLTLCNDIWWRGTLHTVITPWLLQILQNKENHANRAVRLTQIGKSYRRQCGSVSTLEWLVTCVRIPSDKAEVGQSAAAAAGLYTGCLLPARTVNASSGSLLFSLMPARPPASSSLHKKLTVCSHLFISWKEILWCDLSDNFIPHNLFLFDNLHVIWLFFFISKLPTK